jgi:cyclopropane fatty-acyl-phospholipid synthase-like methyltransferase
MKSLLLVLLFVLPAYAQQPSTATQQRRDPDEYIKLLEGERRVAGLQVARVIEALQIKPGQRIADLGSGAGLFSRPLAKKVGAEGVVYAIDVDQALLNYVTKTAAQEQIANIVPILATEADPKLTEPVDLIVIIDTLHHIKNQPTYLKGLKKHLRTGGRIAIIDFSKQWPAGHESMIYKLNDLEGWMKAAGFKRVAQHDFLDNNFFVIYQ